MLSQTLKAFWFETRHGKSHVIRAFQDKIRDRSIKSYFYIKIKYRAWLAASDPQEETAAIFVPRAWEFARPDVRRAVLANVLMREQIPAAAITSMTFVRDQYTTDGFHPKMERKTNPLNIQDMLAS